MAGDYTIPRASVSLSDPAGMPSREWYNFFRTLSAASSTATLTTEIADIATILGSPNGEVATIPPLAFSAGKVIGYGSIYAIGQLPNLVTVALVNDNVAPLPTSVYGSDTLGNKGWFPLFDGFATTTLALSADPVTGIVSFDLPLLADSGVGAALVRITRDGYGRISGTHAATTTDLAEGTNLYFTNARADARITLQKAQPLGLATLDAAGKLDTSQLPALAITETFVVATQAAMLALTAQEGDVAVRTDLSKSFILTASPASTLANWQELLTPSSPVTSIFGRVGSVTAQTGDYTPAQVGLANVDNTSDVNKPVSTAQAAAIAQKGPDTSAKTNIEVNLSAAQTITVGSFNAIVFNTKVRDALSEFNASTGVWTVSAAGLYSVVFFAHFAGAADAATLANSIFVNGVENKRVGEQTVSNPSGAMSVGGSCGSSCLIQLAAGDVVALNVYMSSSAVGASPRIDQYTALTYFQALRIL